MDNHGTIPLSRTPHYHRSGASRAFMGNKLRRSRSHLGPGEICYLCGKLILADEVWNRDHLPPERFFGKSVRDPNHVQLEWLPTHAECNSGYRPDEEYFVTALAGQLDSPTARAVWADIGRGAAKGHGHGLIRTTIGQFGKIALPDGSVIFHLDTARVHRVIWKIVRGLYTLLSGTPLCRDPVGLIEIISPSEAGRRLTNHPWFSLVRDTPSIATYGGVFDYKWICVGDAEHRGHGLAMLLWDRLVILTLWHDSTCPCRDCVRDREQAAVQGNGA